MNITDEVMRCLRAGIEMKTMRIEQGVQNYSSELDSNKQNDLLDEYFDLSEGVKFYTMHCNDNEIDSKFEEIKAKYKTILRQQHFNSKQT